ncbi:hypothetical protein [Geopsychrobacter electrodiphilus]|uniref:hypothetical protein n=1 Tax=Geopsychrobacter electrodiphilus TaxID=225196 RepID=UPI000369EED4|nr:hypothetical protein [Geopsychrobacter electrodiphilus]
MPEPLTNGRIFRFWLPLLGTWMLMAIDGPLLTALIARMVDAKLNLAAYGVAFSFALVAEAPIIMLMSASTSLASNPLAYRRLRRFTAVLTSLITLGFLVFLIPPVYTLVMERLVGLSPAIANHTHWALLALLPWPAAIGWRRFYQGILIRSGQTPLVAFSTVFRLAGMAGCGFWLFSRADVPGALLGGMALSCGVLAEFVASRFLARRAIAGVLASPQAGEVLSYPALWRYYLPLALTPFITLGVQPLVIFFLGKGRMPLESLAVMPVLAALTFIFRAIGLSFQEVAIALLGRDLRGYLPMRNFAWGLALFASGALMCIALTPLAPLWLHQVSGLNPELVRFSRLPLILMALLPAGSVLSSFQRGVLMEGRVTRPISTATIVEATVIFGILTLLLLYSSWSGALCAAMAYVVGRLMAILWMVYPCRLVLAREAVGRSC